MSEKIWKYAPWLLLGIAVLIRWRNWVVFPHAVGLDGYGHSNYLDLILERNRLPLPIDGWQTYHPPGYYQMSAWVAQILGWAQAPDRYQAGKLVSALAGFLTLFALYQVSKRLLPEFRCWPILFMAVLPASVTVSAMVYNMSAALALATCFIVLIVLLWDTPPTFSSEVSLGLCLGAAVLVRTDAAPLGLLLILRAFHLARKTGVTVKGPVPWPVQVMAGLGLSLAVLGSVTSWFFLRNLSLHGHFLVANLDPDVFPYPHTSNLGLPGFFTPRFLVDTGGMTLWSNPLQPEGISSLTGSLYASFWTDHSGTWLSFRALAPWRLLAGVPPSLLCLIGLKAVWKQPSWRPVLLVFSVNVMTGLWLINKVSTYTGYKAIYLYASFPVWSLLSAAGLRHLSQKSQTWARSTQLLLLVCYAFLAASLVWMPS